MFSFSELINNPNKIPLNIISSSIPGTVNWNAKVSKLNLDFPNKNQIIVDRKTIVIAAIKAFF